MSPRAPTRQYPRTTELVCGPFRGMRDAPEPTTADPGLALLIQNGYRASGPVGGGIVGRPGTVQMGSALAASTGRVGQAGPFTWTPPTGTRQTVAVCKGIVSVYDWSLGTWSTGLSSGTLSGASITLSTTARVALVPFGDVLVISDGVNVPWTWDGTVNGGVTKLTNCPVLYGPPVVYYSKLFGIKNAARQTTVWSEEGDPATGYEAGGYNNAWDNPGGYPDPLTSLAATNDALYVFRARTSIAITGAVGPDFATAGTRANLAEKIGTSSPYATRVIDQGVLVVDSDAQPWLMRLGADPLPLWPDCRQTLKATPRASLGNALTVVDLATRNVLVGLPNTGDTYVSQWLAFNQDDLQFVGVWDWGAEAQSADLVVDLQGVQRWAHSEVDTGVMVAHGTPADGPWNDAVAGSTVYIAHGVTGATLGFDLDRELRVDMLEAGFTGEQMTNVSMAYETPRGESMPLQVTLTNPTEGFRLDVSQLGVGVLGAQSRSQQARVGTAGLGRWVRPIIRHAELNERFGLDAIRVRVTERQGNAAQP